VVPEDQIPNNNLFLITIDIEERRSRSEYKQRDPNICQALLSVALY